MQERENPHRRELAFQLSQVMDWLEFRPYEFGVQILLRAMGYKEVRIVGRSNWRGRSNFGGLDIICWRPTRTGKELTLVQVKQSKKVQRRFVDEMRSAMRVHGAERGVIMTSKDFAKAAIDRVAFDPRLPVRLIDGPEIGRLMLKHFVGLRLRPILTNTMPEPVLDELFFETLERMAEDEKAKRAARGA